MKTTPTQYVVIDRLTNYFKDTGLTFNLIGSDYIDSDAMNKLHYTNCQTLCQRNVHKNAIDVYIQSDGSALGAAGVTPGIGAKAFVSNSKYYDNTTTLAHELGHALGLYHTHHGTGETGGKPELVNGSNSKEAGDYVTDTPADPDLWNNSDKKYDSNGQMYVPDIYNLMCYNPDKDKRTHLTPGQLSRINYTLDNHQEIIATRTKIYPYTITGQKWLNTQETYTVNFPSSYSLNWSVECRLYSSKSEFSSSISNSNKEELTLVNTDQGSNSKKYMISAYGTSSKGFTFKESKSVFFLQPSDATSSLRYIVLNANGSTLSQGDIPINLSSSNLTITVPKGGALKFTFYDSCGVTNSDVDFSLWMNGFTKDASVKGKFNCSVNAASGLQNSPLNILWSSKSKVVPLKVVIQ